MKQKWISLLLALTMILSLWSPALAADKNMDNFAAIRTYADNFADVAATDWFYDSVKTCYEYGLMEGSGGKFNPSGNLTVAQALVMADRVHGIYTTGKDELKNGTPWYQPYVDYALTNGIIQSTDFADYNAAITRAQMAYVFSRALPAAEFTPINAIGAYPPDVAQGSPYADVILTLYRAGVVTGNDSYGTFRPDSPIARREAAAIIARIAIPSQRKSFTMLQDYVVDSAVTVTAPAGYQFTTTADGQHELNMDFLITQVLIEPGSGAGLSSILELPADLVTAMLTASFAESLPGSKTSTAMDIVAFGATPAYRLNYRVEIPDETFSALTTEGHCYLFILGDTLYTVHFVMVYPGTQCPAAMASVMKTMVNRATVNGTSVSVKMR